MFPVLQIGSLALQVPGLVLLAGLWIGLSVAEKHASKFRLHPDHLYRLMLSALLSGLIGARLVYVLRFPRAFLQNPVDLVSLNPGLLDLAGGLAVAAIGALISGQRLKLPLFPTLDALVPLFAVLQISAGFSNLASGDAFGLPTDLPWAMTIWGAARHPYQVYAILSGVLILCLTWPKTDVLRSSPAGRLFFKFITFSSFAWLFLDAFREDSPALANGIRIYQLAAWLLAAIGLAGWFLIQKTKRREAHG
jgi:phosphatidylglycerol:prolipoprotein diacylglycerol transferase